MKIAKYIIYWLIVNRLLEMQINDLTTILLMIVPMSIDVAIDYQKCINEVSKI